MEDVKMHRLDVRCKVDLPVTIISNEKEIKAGEARFTVLSLNGGFIKCPYHLPENTVVCIRYELPRYGEFEALGEVLRRYDNGFATRFRGIGRDVRIKLWQYIRENIEIQERCPYCGEKLDRGVRRCNSCGLSLNFNSASYLIEHERETFLKRLEQASGMLSIEDIYRVLNFIDREILKVGRGNDVFEEFIGSCPQMLDVFSMIRKVALLDVPVLIRGEKGTGKEFTARAIHERSKRRHKPFVSIDCSDVPEDILERELFGDTQQIGTIRYAEGGTVLIKQVEKLPSRLQSKIEEFLDKKTVDTRLLFSTDIDVEDPADSSLFNNDLYNKIMPFVIYLPPVRKRGDDKLILARYFLNKFSREVGGNKRFSDDAVRIINTYEWRGNVKEIINRTRRAVVVSEGDTVTPDDMGLRFSTDDVDLSIRHARDEIEKQKLIEALNRFNHNISKTARALGISRPTVYKIKRKFGI